MLVSFHMFSEDGVILEHLLAGLAAEELRRRRKVVDFFFTRFRDIMIVQFHNIDFKPITLWELEHLERTYTNRCQAPPIEITPERV